MNLFNDIFKPKKNINIENNEFLTKLKEIDTVKNEIKNYKFNVDEKLLENKKESHNFEQNLNDDVKNFYKIYNSLIKDKEELFLNRINYMKNIYKNLSNSKIKEDIDETNKKIISLKTLKEKISQNNEIISQKIKSVNEKINKYELTDEETENYLKILFKYQKEMGDKLIDIEKGNQKKYMKMEKNINARSEELYIKEK